jgi:hypothetical protein
MKHGAGEVWGAPDPFTAPTGQKFDTCVQGSGLVLYLEASKDIVHSLFSESDECSEAYFSWGGDGIVKSESHHF